MQVFVHNRNEFIDSQISKQDRMNGTKWNGLVPMNQNGVLHVYVVYGNWKEYHSIRNSYGKLF